MTDVSWDYSKRAKTFDKRANYDVDAINCMLQDMGCVSHKPVADIGAGTGKLTNRYICFDPETGTLH